MLKRIVNVVGWVGTALVFGAVGIRLFKPDWAQYGYWGAWAGLAFVVAYMLGQWRETMSSMTRRQTRLGTIAASSVIVVLGLLVAVNYLASRRNHRWDLTANQQFSLSPQTRQILQKLDAPVKIRVYDRPNEFDRFRDRLDEYTYASNKVSVEYLDIDKQPVRANRDQVQANGTVVFDYKGRTERVASSDESQLTNGLIKVLTGKERKVYFLQGHGERDTTVTERGGYSAISSALGAENFTVEPLVLLQQGTVPADAAIVVVAGPKTDLFPPEIDALKKYLDGAGKVLLLLDPPDKADAQPLTNLVAFAKDWGIDVGRNVVVDISGVGQIIGTDESVPVAARYPAHPITENFKLLTAYPLARSVTATPGGVNGHAAQNFIESSKNSWAETDLDGMFKSGKVQDDKDKDLQGPVSMGAAVSMTVDKSAGDAKDTSAAKNAKADDPDAPKPEARMVVIGDSDFAANYALGIQGNRDLFMNAMNWLGQQENLISIRPKEPDDRRITLTASEQRTINWFALLVLPAAVFAAGIFSWSRRRG
jgi:gliding motility-associatede transport system auxiliary component